MKYVAAYSWVYTTQDFTALNWFKRKGSVLHAEVNFNRLMKYVIGGESFLGCIIFYDQRVCTDIII